MAVVKVAQKMESRAEDEVDHSNNNRIKESENDRSTKRKQKDNNSSVTEEFMTSMMSRIA